MTNTQKKRIFIKRGGCNEDCFNCKYPDCYKPAKDIKPMRDLDIRVVKSENNNTCL